MHFGQQTIHVGYASCMYMCEVSFNHSTSVYTMQSLSECTQPMDAHTWNTYHIISNRARSVCYATRQQQFRRQTELAVNKLSAATIDQLQAMEDLSSSQQQIKQATIDSLKVSMERMCVTLRVDIPSTSTIYRAFKSTKITCWSHKRKS